MGQADRDVVGDALVSAIEAGYFHDTAYCGGNIESLRERMPTVTEPEPGMTLRDYFAAKALTGFVCNASFPDLLRKGFNPEFAAEAAYLIADAMIAQRSK
jgi:hypothetical protein